MNRNLPALSEALEDWRDLASDRDAADALLHFDETRRRLEQLRGHIEKLRTDPPQFDATDLTAVLDMLGSAQQMRRQIVEGNELDVIVPTLRGFLFDEDESIEEKFAEYPPRVRYAGHTILAELWGWTHIDRWPLYNQHAVKGLRLLGWQVPSRDYPTFARLFGDLRAFYEQGSRVAQTLPLNLEIDHFLEWVNMALAPPARSKPVRDEELQDLRLAPHPPRNSYAIREFGAPYDAAPVPPHSWADRPLPAPSREQMEQAERRIREQLALPAGVIRRAAAHLLAGRHLILTGAPGTGKSHLAMLLASELFGYYPMLVTATAEWSTFDVVGGLVPLATESGALRYDVRPGVVYEALRRNWLLAGDGTVRRDVDGEALRVGTTHEGRQWPGVWLIIDELNRADVDKAFGELFTALESGALRVPRAGTDPSHLIPLPKDFRILATLNTRDRHFLFTLSDALKRRFAFIEIETPQEAQEEQEILLRRAHRALEEQGLEVDEEILRTTLDQLYPIASLLRAFQPLGSAPLLAVLRYVGATQQIVATEPEEVVQEAIIAEVLPQLEGLRELPLRLLALLFHGDRGAALTLLADSLTHSYSNAQPLRALHAFASLISPALAEQTFLLQRASLIDPTTLSDALAILDELHEHSDTIPAPTWKRVATHLDSWLAERE